MSDDSQTQVNTPVDDTAEVVETPESVEETVVEEEVTTPDTVEVSEVIADTSHLSDFRVGDTIKIYYKIIEGKKERIQPYEGVVIAMKGSDVSRTFTVRKIGADNVGVERIFPFSTPNLVRVDVIKRGKVRRSKLYYLRNAVGRAANKIKEATSK